MHGIRASPAKDLPPAALATERERAKKPLGGKW